MKKHEKANCEEAAEAQIKTTIPRIVTKRLRQENVLVSQ
jgi:hypothetical protein